MCEMKISASLYGKLCFDSREGKALLNARYHEFGKEAFTKWCEEWEETRKFILENLPHDIPIISE